MYAATVSRPDIAFTVNTLCKVMSRPTPEIYAEAVACLVYLHHHRDLGLRYSSDASILAAYSDSDWATEKSTMGIAVMWHKCVIDWSSVQQPSTALSSCETKLMAGSETAKCIMYYRMLLDELGHPCDLPTKCFIDNTAARDLAYNPEHHKRTKHIERRHFFIRELVERLVLCVPFVKSKDNKADFFTKIFSPGDFFRLRQMVMNKPEPEPTPELEPTE